MNSSQEVLLASLRTDFETDKKAGDSNHTSCHTSLLIVGFNAGFRKGLYII